MTIHELRMLQKSEFDRGRTTDPKFRRSLLKNLRGIINDLEDEISEALQMDLHKCTFESYSTEISIVGHELDLMIKKCLSWSRRKNKRLELFHWPSKGFVLPQPFGSVLVIAPWNYPFALSMMPVIGALVAGNTVVLKPSEFAPATARILTKIAELLFLPSVFSVITGGPETGKELLEEQWDYIFATGGEKMGKIIAQAAVKNLTPVTLELGGKSPCIVTQKADLEIAARRIAWGKFVNAGQTCVATDYILIPKSIKEKFCSLIEKSVKEFYGEDPLRSPDYSRIINAAHFQRLKNYLSNGRIVFGGKTDEEQKYIEPTVLTDCHPGSPVLMEEVFGPILLVLDCESVQEAVEFINARPLPLALYCFSKDKKEQELVLQKTRSGGVCLNETIMHCASSNLPFGGVGMSGMGYYHGENSFNTFSRYKGVIRKPAGFDLPLRYPPYKKKLGLIRKIM